MVAEDRELTLPATVLGDAGENTHLVRQLQLTLPLPGGQQVALFTLAAECLFEWDDYIDIMGGIAQTIAFLPPGEDRQRTIPRATSLI